MGRLAHNGQYCTGGFHLGQGNVMACWEGNAAGRLGSGRQLAEWRCKCGKYLNLMKRQWGNVEKWVCGMGNEGTTSQNEQY